MAGDAIPRYRHRLEDTALVLHLSGKEELARQGLFQALSFIEDRPPHTIPFARAVVNLSVIVVDAVDRGPEDDKEPAAPSLIERI